MTMNKAYNPTWFTSNELSQITPMPEAWDRTASGPSHCTTTVSDCAAVYSYLDSQSKNLSRLGVVADLVDRRRPVAADQLQLRRQLHVRARTRPTPARSRPSWREFQEVPFTTESAEYNVLQAGTHGGGQTDRRRLPAHHRRAAEPRRPPRSAPTRSTATPCRRCTRGAINYFPLNYQSTTGNGPILKQLYFRQALQYLMNQAAVIKGPLKGYGVPDGRPGRVVPGDQVPVGHGQAGRPVALQPDQGQGPADQPRLERGGERDHDLHRSRASAARASSRGRRSPSPCRTRPGPTGSRRR